MVFRQGDETVKFASIDATIIQKMDHMAEEYFNHSMLEGEGYRKLAKFFNDNVVTPQNTVEALTKARKQKEVPYKQVTYEDMEKHYSVCVTAPLVIAKNSMVRLEKMSLEMLKSDQIVHEHLTRRTKTNKMAKRFNPELTKQFLWVEKAKKEATELYDKLRKSNTGFIFKKGANPAGTGI